MPTTGSLDASVEYHEYTHGLSNRLVVDANGNSTLNDIQSGSMGEAWSDYYAMDYLVTKGFMRDTAKAGQLLEGKYVAANGHLIRTMAIDCPVGRHHAGLHSGLRRVARVATPTATSPTIVGGPEVHGSGEIWGQTLWDLRTALGHRVADTMITRGMSLSADDPDFLDMRNAILRADLVAYDGQHRASHLEGLRAPRHGLLRRFARLGRLDAGRGLPHAAAGLTGVRTTARSPARSPTRRPVTRCRARWSP